MLNLAADERRPEMTTNTTRRRGRIAIAAATAALAEFDVRHNAAWDQRGDVRPPFLSRIGSKFYRIGRKLPVFLRNA